MKIFVQLTQIVILASAVNAQAAKLLVDVNLLWKPTTELVEMSKLVKNKTSSLKVELSDKRAVEPLTRIGQNTEEPKSFLPVETKENIATFVQQHLSDTFEKVDLQIKEDHPDYILAGDIKEFFSAETNTYAGILTIHFYLKTGGKTIWEKVISGKNSRFGRSYKYDNYMESLSDSIIDTAYKVLENEEFKTAFQTKKGKN